MTRHELMDKYWHEFLIWCSMPPKDAKTKDLIDWIDWHYPTEDNFWEWIIKYKSKELHNAEDPTSASHDGTGKTDGESRAKTVEQKT